MPDFSFLFERAGFQIAESLLDAGPADTYLRVLAAGLVNTLTVVALALPLATVLGLAIGLLRLTRHPLVYRAMAAVVEPVRNTPVLLQLFVWYSLLLNLPEVREAWQPLSGVFLSNRGLALPMLQGASLFVWPLCGVVVASAVAVIALPGRRARVSCIAVLWTMGAVWFARLPTPSVDGPALAGFGLEGGWSLSPEFTALVVGLTLFHAVYISDIVRGAVFAVPLGQVEAARALGMRWRAVTRTTVFPFAIRSAVPPYTNQCLMLLKNSTLAIAIGYQELMAIVNTTVTQTGRALEGMGLAAACYLAASGVMALLLSHYNRRVNRQGIDGTGLRRLGQTLGLPRMTSSALWSEPWRAATSAMLLLLTAWATVTAIRWALWSAVWTGPASACEQTGGACWAAVAANWPLLMFGTMTADQRPAALLAVGLVLAGVAVAMQRKLRASWRAVLAVACALLAALALSGLAGRASIPPMVWGGVLVTVVMAVASIALALPLAVALMLMRRSAQRWLSAPAVLLIETVRAVPLVTELLLVSFLVPVLVGGDWSAAKFQLALTALVLHTACLLAEVLRGALQAVPASQGVSARALGMRPATVLWSVLLPQARRIAAPAALGVFVGAVKDTSLVAVIGVFDVLSAAKSVVADTGWRPYYTEVYLVVALFYFLVCLWLSRVAERLRHQPASA